MQLIVETRHQRVVTDLRRTWWTVSPFPARGLSVAANFDKENVSPVSLFEREREREAKAQQQGEQRRARRGRGEGGGGEWKASPVEYTRRERERERDGREIGREGIAA